MPIARSALVNLAPHRMFGTVYSYFFRTNLVVLLGIRSYATNNPKLDEAQAATYHPRLSSLFQLLDALAPRFMTKGSNIEIIHDPKEFYSTLLRKISTAKERIFLSSLYLGKSQDELVQCLADAMEKNDDLKVYVLTDALRGTREAPQLPCLALLLVSLVDRFGPHRADIRMYHTPHLSGLKKNLAPKRLNETFGLQHMKLYGLDQEVILSGANLSEDYFTDRQDRYYVFKDKNITEYYFKVHCAVSSLSYQLLTTSKPKGYQNFRLSWPSSNKSCEPDLNLHRFLGDSSLVLEPLLKQHDLDSFEEFSNTEDADTIIYAVLQFTPLLQPNNDASTEKPVILRLLSFLDSPKIKWYFTAGYFNMLPQIQQKLLNGQAQGTIITASMKANSFYKSSGASYYIPEAYLLVAKKFLEEITKRGKEQLIKLYEWQNGLVNTPGGWSYHAKGIWISVPNEDEPSITVVGSSNYTRRAYSLDLESNAVIITKDADLKRRMKAEIDNLMIHAQQLTLEDFRPKIQESSAKPQVDAQGNTVIAPPVMVVDPDRVISYRVHLGLKLLGDKL